MKNGPSGRRISREDVVQVLSLRRFPTVAYGVWVPLNAPPLSGSVVVGRRVFRAERTTPVIGWPSGLVAAATSTPRRGPSGTSPFAGDSRLSIRSRTTFASAVWLSH
jgi:hypothetical protein